MFNKTAPKSLKDTFEADVFDWFSRTRAGHMEQYQYLEPIYANDPVRGSKLWNAWEAVAPEDNMLKRQGQIIEEQVQDMVAMTKPRRTLVDLGTGALSLSSRRMRMIWTGLYPWMYPKRQPIAQMCICNHPTQN
jgi:hypothetical protein